MAYTELWSEKNELLAFISPASYNSEQNTGSVSVANYHRWVCVIECGVIGGNLDIDVEQDLSTAGSSRKALDSAAKDMTKTATTDNNTVSYIEGNTSELDVDGGYDCVNIEITPASAGIFSVLLFGVEPRFAAVANTLVDDINY